jgi:hypothetical protein
MGRRSSEQICIDLRRERGNLYSKRSRVLRKLQNKKVQGQNRVNANNEWDSVQNRLYAIKEQLFRCGKKYSKFKKQRTKLRRHQRYLLDKSKSGKLNKKEAALNFKEMRRTAEVINQIENAMLLPVGKMKTGVTGFIAVKGGRFKADEVLWALASMFDSWANSGDFSILVLDDEVIDMAGNPIEAKIKVDMAIQDAMAWQHINPSPHFYVFGDVANGYLEIMVKNYDTDMFRNDVSVTDTV